MIYHNKPVGLTEPQIHIINEDSIEWLQKLFITKSTNLMPIRPDLVITDPPYGLNKKGIKNDHNFDTYRAVRNLCYDILPQNAFFITFFSTKYLNEAFDFDNPFKYFWNIALYCPNGAVNSPIGFTKYMNVLVFKKGNPKVVKRCKDIFVDTPGRAIEPDEGFIDHPTPKPKAFIRELLKMFSYEHQTVLDPFLGSGSTAMACKQMGQSCIGIDIEEKYCDLAQDRIRRFHWK